MLCNIPHQQIQCRLDATPLSTYTQRSGFSGLLQIIVCTWIEVLPESVTSHVHVSIKA